MPQQLSKLTHLIGIFIALACVYFIGVKLSAYIHAAEIKSIFNEKNIIYLFIFSLIYGLNLILLVLAWRQLIIAHGGFLSVEHCFSIYGKSQIAKYLPGNIFHFAGRQVLGHMHGVSHATLIKTSLWEIILIAVSAIIIGLLKLIDILSSASALNFLFIIGILVTVILIAKNLSQAYLKAFLAYFLFHAVAGFLFILAINLLQQGVFIQPLSAINIMSAYVLAWLIGFFTPGAPGGIGVREVALLTLVGKSYPEETILLALLLSRIITTMGDVWLFIAASLQKNNKEYAV